MLDPADDLRASGLDVKNLARLRGDAQGVSVEMAPASRRALRLHHRVVTSFPSTFHAPSGIRVSSSTKAITASTSFGQISGA